MINSNKESRESNEKAHFIFMVTLPSNIQVRIARTKVLDRYLDFETMLIISPEQEEILKKFSKEQATRVMDELLLEMARLDVEWKVDDPLLKSILLAKLVPITSNLTEDVFIGYLHAMGNARILAETKLSLALTSNR